MGRGSGDAAAEESREPRARAAEDAVKAWRVSLVCAPPCTAASRSRRFSCGESSAKRSPTAAACGNE